MLTQEDDVEIHALARGAGRSPRSAGTPAGTARRSRSTWPAGGPSGGSGRRAVLSRIARISRRGSSMTRTASDACCIAELVDARVRSVLPDAGAGAARARSCGRCAWCCSSAAGRTVTVEIDHRPGEEIQWDWLELARDAVGRAGVRAGRRAVALRPVAGGVLRADDVRAPGRGACTRCCVALGGTPRGRGGPTGWRRS